MSHLVLIDEPALKECVESNIYQSRHFEAGANLARALGGDKKATSVSLRVVPTWRKDFLYLLQSRIETGYLCVDSAVFDPLLKSQPQDTISDDILLIFQRVCRFALKEWNGLGFSFSEMWSPKTGCGVVFPYPKSRSNGYRITIRRPELDKRLAVRHGTKQLFAFAGGFEEEAGPTSEQERLYKRALEELSPARQNIAVQIQRAEQLPSDIGYHPLVLTQAPAGCIKYQAYEEWAARLTTEQKRFVESLEAKPQRVEGPAGTGKTLCLLLRSFFLCKTAEQLQTEFRVLFVAHSEPTRSATALSFDSLGSPFYHQKGRNEAAQTVELCTLQYWCGRVLGAEEVANSQYLDQDALQSKELRKLIIKDAVAKRLKDDPKSLEYLSPECRQFFQQENQDYISELLQHEIGVMIKGRASEQLDAYLQLPHLTYCLPASTQNDRRFVFSLYTAYQKDINSQGVFDTDDIVLSTLGRLNTPIWRRRRATEGYDAIVIDETHLFNLNELSVFHHLLKDPHHPRIIFSIDRSQAPGERGITTGLVREILTQSSAEEAATRTKIVFRSSPNIVKLAEAITSAGATLFTTFENPLLDTTAVITASDESLSRDAIYWKCTNDQQMCTFAVKRAKEIANKLLKCPANEVLVVATTDDLLSQLSAGFQAANLNWVQIVQRGDLDTVQRGAREHAFIVSHPDYVGGLEFKAVLIVGTDEGRVPPTEGAVRDEAKHFVEFKACNRMYVAISRARLIVEMFYSSERGPSPLLQHARAEAVLVEKDAAAENSLRPERNKPTPA